MNKKEQIFIEKWKKSFDVLGTVLGEVGRRMEQNPMGLVLADEVARGDYDRWKRFLKDIREAEKAAAWLKNAMDEFNKEVHHA